MNSRYTTVALTALAAITATGCATQVPADPIGNGTTCGATGFDAPFEHVDPCDPEQVLTAALRAVFGYRPDVQADPADALDAARPLLDDRFAAGAAASALVWSPVTPAVWQQWRRERVPVVTTVGVRPDDHPPDTGTRVARVVSVDIDAPVSDPDAFAVYATATRAGVTTAWRLSGLQVTQ
ncbi:hypothetical protein [Nocardia noduli]|uniref:hypothetical protein n=1 Tax=Nocardia noduli TaxID=2815722 RepID=UPI001C216F66|nr:hypothetical protein [Nocardia noduli]